MSKAKRFFTREIVPQRVFTTDAILSTPTRAELEANQRHTSSMTGLNRGTRWTGDLKPVGDAVARVIDALRRVKDRARQHDALSEAVVAIANFGNDLGTSEAGQGPAGALAFSGSQDEMRGGREEDISGHAVDTSTSATPEDINRANDKFWADRLGKTRATDSAPRGLSTRATAESINAANKAFYSQEPYRFGAAFGKG